MKSALRIVALHGFLGKSGDWQPLQTALSAKGVQTQTYAFDFFSPGSTGLKTENFPAWIEDFSLRLKTNDFGFSLEKSPNSPRILLGYSFGGRLALQLANHFPQLWDHVFLISSHIGGLPYEERRIRYESDAAWAQKFQKLPWNEVIAEWNAQAVFIGSTAPARLEGDFDKSLLAKGLTQFSLAKMHELIKPAIPVTWVCGENDEKYRTFYEELKRATVIERFAVIPGAGHRLIFDNPLGLAELLVSSVNV